MNFDLTKPCADCPFRSDGKGVGLRQGRVMEIIDSLMRGHTFVCHKTSKTTSRSKKEQHCAGALIFLEDQEAPNQMMRIAERCGFYDRTKLDRSVPTWEDEDAMLDGQPEWSREEE